MTARERIDAAIVAREKATPGPLEVQESRDGGSTYSILAFDERGQYVVASVNSFLGSREGIANATLIAAAPDLVDEVIRLRKAIIEYEMALASEGALILNHEGHIAKLDAKIELLRKWQSEAVEIIKHVVHIPEDGIYDRLIAEAQGD